ncbi:MAG: alpha-galactosidase [Lachnospiraceae bacterium]|nr:alpha-galactosidase [Lachnospiraceae bacterium]
MNRPAVIRDAKYRYDGFHKGEVFSGKRKGRLPAMGWNSWNAFGSGNTEELTKQMADKIVELCLDELGYEYVVLDDGCYRPERVDGKLANEERKFPSGFRALSDYIHSKGLKFGMYNDIGTNLCAGAAVGTCGHEKTDAKSYLEWGVDFIKVDNCYYLWDNATFSAAGNARYTYAPAIRELQIAGAGRTDCLEAKDAEFCGAGVRLREDGCAVGIGTFDGTGPQHSPAEERSGELCFSYEAAEEGEYAVRVVYISGEEPEIGSWLQIAVGEEVAYDELLPVSMGLVSSEEIRLSLKKGTNQIRLMNHRRQENTLVSYATLLEAFHEEDPEADVLLSICEWGKTQPQDWGWKVGDSWRILNDITFRVGADGDPGYGSWESDYTPGVAPQYNKAVIMDEFAGLDKGWNDPDMLMVGMNGLDMTECRTHFAMWCMLNSPLMLGLDLRRVRKDDELYRIIADRELIALNQDPLGVQAKRVFSTLAKERPDTEYIRDNERVDALAKPLADGSIAVAFFNLSGKEQAAEVSVELETILAFIGDKMPDAEGFGAASSYCIRNLSDGTETLSSGRKVAAEGLPAHGSKVFRIRAV